MGELNDPVHFTTLKKIARSPAHYMEALLNPKAPTSAMGFGLLVHEVLLGGPPSAVWEGERRGNAWKDFKAANAGRNIVTAAESNEATRIANILRNHPIAGPLLDGFTEVPVAWNYLGRSCATRGIDVVPGAGTIVDLKTTYSAEPQKFGRIALWDQFYHAQLAWYRAAVESLGKPVNAAYLIAVESEPPYPVTVMRVTPRALEAGEKLCRLWMERLLACEAANEWPGYVQDVIDLDVSEVPKLFVEGDDEETAA